jgi:radical SAM superfamily enzyme YgiQ (UPF0313 family)
MNGDRLWAMLELYRPDVTLATPPPLSHRTAEENLGLGYLASVLRKNGQEVQMVDGWLNGLSSHELASEILGKPPKIFLGFSCYRSNMERTMEVANLLRQSGLDVPLIVGGYGPTFDSEEFLKAGFDIVVRGEAEDTILDLYSYFVKGTPDLDEIKGISYMDSGEIRHNPSRPLKLDIDQIPFPSRDTMPLTIKRKSAVHIASARGCQAHCVFCSIVSFQKLSEGPQWRQRSIKNFVDELELLNKEGARYFKVIDDSFIEPPRDESWCKALADEIKTRGLNIRLRSSIRADRVTDGVIKELKRAGFFAFSCGIENGSETALKRMGKSATLEQNVQALEIFKKYGIYVQAGHILFDHGTTMQELEQNYEFMRKYIWTISKGTFTEMYAADGTPFTRLLSKKNLLKEDENGLDNNTYEVQDSDPRKVYKALKLWHKSHLKTYDMTIDAISAPKALKPEELALFHPLCIELRQMDLDYMREILDLIEEGLSEEEVLKFARQKIESSKFWYGQFERKVLDTYQKTGLVYDADENPFVN